MTFSHNSNNSLLDSASNKAILLSENLVETSKQVRSSSRVYACDASEVHVQQEQTLESMLDFTLRLMLRWRLSVPLLVPSDVDDPHLEVLLHRVQSS